MIRLYFIWLSYLLFTLNRLTGQEAEEDTLRLAGVGDEEITDGVIKKNTKTI